MPKIGPPSNQWGLGGRRKPEPVGHTQWILASATGSKGQDEKCLPPEKRALHPGAIGRWSPVFLPAPIYSGVSFSQARKAGRREWVFIQIPQKFHVLIKF